MVQEPSHVTQLSPIHVCKIGLSVFSVQAKILLAYSETTVYNKNHYKIAVISVCA